ncbi:hypothetical protein D3C78_887710 [compost metagenome]
MQAVRPTDERVRTGHRQPLIAGGRAAEVARIDLHRPGIVVAHRGGSPPTGVEAQIERGRTAGNGTACHHHRAVAHLSIGIRIEVGAPQLHRTSHIGESRHAVGAIVTRAHGRDTQGLWPGGYQIGHLHQQPAAGKGQSTATHQYSIAITLYPVARSRAGTTDDKVDRLCSTYSHAGTADTGESDATAAGRDAQSTGAAGRR